MMTENIPPSGNLDELARIGYTISMAASQALAQDSCLTRSVYLQWLPHRRAIAADLRLRMQREGNQRLAHSWVKYRGMPPNDNRDVTRRFLPCGRSLATKGATPP